MVKSVSVGVDITHDFTDDLVVDLIAPDGTSVMLHGGNSPEPIQTYTPDLGGINMNGDWTLRVQDNASIGIGTLNTWTLTVEYEDTEDPVLALSGSGTQYLVTVLSMRDGTYNLDVIPDNGITDAAGNPLDGIVPTGTDQSYIVRTGSPTLESITRSSPSSQTADAWSLVFRVIFSEPVTGVTLDDFVLSQDDIGGSGQFTHIRTPSLAIPDNGAAVSDTITVNDIGTVRSVSVGVDITHTYSSDLALTLIAPDGTAMSLQNRVGGSLQNVIQTYMPDLGGINMNGDWTLRINDAGPEDIGTLNEWTLAIEYGKTSNKLEGSGARYLVTVLNNQNGTYNLDVVQNNRITDMAGNPLDKTVPAGEDQSYTVNTTLTPFVTTWRTTTPDESITIPGSGTYAVDWGDGTTSTGVSGSQTHTYAELGDYVVSISGDFTRIHLDNQQPNAGKLLSIDQWGDIRWISMNSAFGGHQTWYTAQLTSRISRQ